jgi:hypothetical protein
MAGQGVFSVVIQDLGQEKLVVQLQGSAEKAFQGPAPREIDGYEPLLRCHHQVAFPTADTPKVVSEIPVDDTGSVQVGQQRLGFLKQSPRRDLTCWEAL